MGVLYAHGIGRGGVDIDDLEAAIAPLAQRVIPMGRGMDIAQLEQRLIGRGAVVTSFHREYRSARYSAWMRLIAGSNARRTGQDAAPRVLSPPERGRF